MIEKNRALKAFHAYTAQYDLEDPMIRHKAAHTLRVAENCERIGESLSLAPDLVAFGWFLGLLHDIGRFEQVRRYGTFLDAVSVDHAAFGADLLFREGLLANFPAEGLSREWLARLETAIRLHNKLTLPSGQDRLTRLFCDLIRDADKADIFRVVSELPFEQRIGSSKGLVQEGEASEEVMACVRQHCCVPRHIRKTRFEGHLSHCCMAFELVYPETRRMVREQGFLAGLLADCGENGTPLWGEKEREQLRILREEIEKILEGIGT